MKTVKNSKKIKSTKSKKTRKHKEEKIQKKTKQETIGSSMELCTCSPDVGDCPKCNKKCYVI
jgi:hypothetical protein